MSWTTTALLAAQLQRLWDQGEFLRSVATGISLFPLRLSLRTPSATDVAERFDEVRSWIVQLRSVDAYRIVWRSVNHRVHGSNVVPAEVWVDAIDHAVLIIGRAHQLARFCDVLETTKQRQQAMLPWLARNPLRVLALADVWGRLLDVIDWLQAHPRPNVYIRQIDVPGVHSKFIEDHRGVLAELLDLSLPADVIEASATGASQFTRRYGFRDKPQRVRFRMLDPALALLPRVGERDITLDAPSFARLDPAVATVFITENEINFLALPDVSNSLVIFGAGYGFDMLADVTWLSRCRVLYWGDVDTHGFAILDQLRSLLPHVESFLMDRETLLAFAAQWGTEAQPVVRELARLNSIERALFNDLRNNEFRHKLRLEQEHIGFEWVQAALLRLRPPT